MKKAAIAIVEGELPAAIEVQPLFALELRLRKLGSWDLLSGGRQRKDRQKKQASDAHGFMVGQALPPVHRMRRPGRSG